MQSILKYEEQSQEDANDVIDSIALLRDTVLAIAAGEKNSANICSLR